MISTQPQKPRTPNAFLKHSTPKNGEARTLNKTSGLHYTGNYLLSHNSVVVLPSATESLTSVFEMGTCVSSRLLSPEYLRRLLFTPCLFKLLVCIRVAIRFTHVDNPYLKKAQCLL